MDKQPRLTDKRRKNLVRLITNAATVIFAGMMIGPFVGGFFRPRIFASGAVLYLAAVAMVWYLES